MNRRNEVAVGLTLIVGIILIIGGIIWMQGLRLGEEERAVEARFREVGQLLTGSTVKYRGVPIGRVEKIELEPGAGGVIVTMSIRGDVPLPDNPVAILAPESMFGDWQAEIAPRSLFPNYEYAEPLDPQVLPGYALPDMSRLTAVADEIAQNLRVMSNRFELAFTEETALNIREAIENIQEVSAQLTGLVGSQQAALEEVAANLERTSEAASQAATTMQRTFAEVETAIGGGKLTNIVSNVERTTVSTDSLVDELLTMSRELRRTASSAETSFERISGITAAIDRGEGTLGQLLRDSALYRQLVETNLAVQALLLDIRQNPRRYINLTIF